MLDSVTNALTETSAETAAALTAPTMLAALLTSLVLGLFISVCWLLTSHGAEQPQSFAVTLIILPAVLTVVILFVGSNVARAFSLAGTLSIIRFRSAPGEPRDIGFVFFSLAAGLSCGVGLYGLGAIFTMALCLVLFVLDRMHFGVPRKPTMQLKITVPEDLNFSQAFEEPLARYTCRHAMRKIRTTELGSLFEVIYTVDLKRGASEKMFLDELRCCNGNLSVQLTLGPTETGGV